MSNDTAPKETTMNKADLTRGEAMSDWMEGFLSGIAVAILGGAIVLIAVYT